jgi:rod shape determining protein RodA
MINLRLLRNVDYILLLCVFALIGIGLMLIFSATVNLSSLAGSDPLSLVKKQLFALGFGLLALIFFAYLDYRHLGHFAAPLYIGIIILLIFVLIKGSVSQGAQRWLYFGQLSLQPSEIVKLAIIIVLAKFFEYTHKAVENFSDLILPALIVLVPFLLTFKQPDLGTAMVFIIILLGMLFWSGSRPLFIFLILSPLVSILARSWLWVWVIYVLGFWGLLYVFRNRVKILDAIMVFAVNLGVGILAPYVWGLLKDYQKQRLVSFLNPEADPFGAGYHVVQSKIAIGSGFLFGKGFLHGTQTQLHFIPHQHTDFIYSIIGEELGFVGALFIFALFFVILWRAVKIAQEADSFFGSLLAGGIASMLGFQLFVNVGMTLGIVPVVGIPLPLISFGGTSLLLNLMAVGILQSIAIRQRKLIFI